MMTGRMTPVFLALLFLAGSAMAFDSGPVRRAVEKGGNWLISQYDFKLKGYPGTTAPEQMGMVVKAICDNPRDYKEPSGPFITEPVKAMLSKIDDAGKVSGVAMNESE